ATDPVYADKILDILSRGTLPQTVGLKSGAAAPTS
ncbi:MAG: flagellar assembly peptidoglycan hydrolase FlgJ, partial [Thioalkalivibrio sp.]